MAVKLKVYTQPQELGLLQPKNVKGKNMYQINWSKVQ